MKNTFNIEQYSDGLLGAYGNHYGISLEEAVEELIYYNFWSEQYTEEELTEYLNKLSIDYHMRGTRWSEFKITKKESEE